MGIWQEAHNMHMPTQLVMNYRIKHNFSETEEPNRIQEVQLQQLVLLWLQVVKLEAKVEELLVQLLKTSHSTEQPKQLEYIKPFNSNRTKFQTHLSTLLNSIKTRFKNLFCLIQMLSCKMQTTIFKLLSIRIISISQIIISHLLQLSLLIRLRMPRFHQQLDAMMIRTLHIYQVL